MWSLFMPGWVFPVYAIAKELVILFGIETFLEENNLEELDILFCLLWFVVIEK